jgi:hypothetical protein
MEAIGIAGWLSRGVPKAAIMYYMDALSLLFFVDIKDWAIILSS